MQTDFKISGKIIFRNLTFNVIGKIIPLIAGVFLLHFIVKGLGVEQFGILSFIWVGLSNYFGLFDFGLGQATIKYVSEAIGENKKSNLPELVWTSFVFNIGLGLIGMVIIIAIVPFFINNILNISPELKDIALRSFSIAAFAVPVVTFLSASRGVLEGAQRYDLLNFVKVPLNVLFFLIPAVSIFFGLNLQSIILFLILAQFIAGVFYLIFCFKALPEIKQGFLIKIKTIRKLFSFGKWMALSNIVFTFLTHIDRFLIGAIISVSAVGFYTAPFDPMARILLVPESLIVLFPVFSAFGRKHKDDTIFYYIRTLKHLVIIMGIVALIIIFFASDILLFWLGQDFKEKSTTVFQFLTFGIFAVSFSLAGENLIKGYGRPDIIAKLRLLEVIPYLLFLWFFTDRFGIKGTAAIWMIRALLDAFLILFISFKLASINLDIIRRSGIVRSLFCLAALGTIMVVGRLLLNSLIFLGFTIFVFVIFILICKDKIWDQTDIKFFKSILIREK